MTIDELKDLDADMDRKHTEWGEAVSARNDAILALVEAGDVSQTDIAQALGVSPGRVSQIAATARLRRSVAPVAA